MSQPASVIAFKKTVLTTPHVNTYNQLSASAKSPAMIAAANGTDAVSEATRLSLLVDEGLAVQRRVPNNPNGATTTTYQLA